MLWIMGPLARGGNDVKMSPALMEEFIALRRRRNQLRLGTLAYEFNQRFQFPMLDGISESTASRYVARKSISRKEGKQVAQFANPMNQLAWLERIAHVDSVLIMDMDEKSASRDNLRNKWAWATIGQEAFVEQPSIVIGGFSFSIISIYTQYGFLVWRIYEDSITSLEVEDFLRQDVDPLVNPNSFLILDNASNHCTLGVRTSLDQIFSGRWDYSEVYSYELKPCEKGLSMVTTWLRARSESVLGGDRQAAIDLIDEGFRVHSIGSERGSRAYGHFSLLQHNHMEYWEDMGL
jgi:hypothetical protein